MEEPRVLLTYHDLTVEAETTPGDELLEHMHSTVLGQPGSLRYQHTDLLERLTSPGENYYMYLRKNGRMIGSVGFCGRRTSTDGTRHDSWLIRYFSIKAPMQTVPSKRREKSASGEETKRSTVLGRFIRPVFAEPSRLRGTDGNETEPPSIIYAVIEKENLRSMNFSGQMGLETVRDVANFSFSRMRPRRSRRLEQLPPEEQDIMIALLERYYSGYTLFMPGPLFRNNDYYVIREGGRIVAGLQIYHVTWKIVDFGDKMSNRIVRLLTRFRWARKRIDPDAFHLLAFDGIYCEKGYEKVLYELMEGVLAWNGAYVAMLMMDSSSGLHDIFRNRGRLGIVHRIVGMFESAVRVRFIQLPEEVRQYFRDHPAYITTYDNS